MAKEVLSMRIASDLKEELKEIENEHIEKILTAVCKNRTDTDTEILILSTKINILNSLTNELINDNLRYADTIKTYTGIIEDNKQEITKLKDEIKKCETRLLKYTDLQQKENGELEKMYTQIINLIHDNNCDDMNVSNCLLYHEYCDINTIIEYCVQKLKEDGYDDYICILESCKINKI